jgi:hypothetical protein
MGATLHDHEFYNACLICYNALRPPHATNNNVFLGIEAGRYDPEFATKYEIATGAPEQGISDVVRKNMRRKRIRFVLGY